MNGRTNVKLSSILCVAAGILAGACFTGAAFASRPGEVGDPLVSLSYLKSAAGFEYTELNEGEEIEIAPGQEFVLIGGKIRLESPGDFKVYDLSRGKSYKNPRSIGEGSLSVFIGNSVVTIHAESAMECLVRGYTLE
jgi:hypothetical protein